MTEVDDILGPKCPECEHRYEHIGHRRGTQWLPTCSQYVPPAAPDAELGPETEPGPAS